jgi:hypothetical protein
MEILAGLTISQMYLGIWALAIVLGVLVVALALERSLLSVLAGLMVAAGMLTAGCFVASIHVLTHPTDARWLPADYVGLTPPDLSRMKDVPFLGDLATELEGWLAQGALYAQSAEAVAHAGRVAGDFAQNGLKAAAVFLVLALWVFFRLLRANRRTRRVNVDRISQLEKEVRELKRQGGVI